MQDLTRLEGTSVKGAIEAMLLCSADPVGATDLAGILGVAPGEAASALAELAADYADANRGFQLREVAGGWRMFSHPAYHDQVEALMDKGLVREAGKDPRRTQAIRYGTTQKFLERFGLKSLRELPNLEEFAPDEESKRFIRERLSGRSIESTLEEAADDMDEERELLDEESGDALGDGPAADMAPADGRPEAGTSSLMDGQPETGAASVCEGDAS